MITVQLELTDDLEDGAALDIVEDRGQVVFRIDRRLTPEEIIEVLNEGVAQLLAGGHWFQEWKGDIIRVDPPRASQTVPPQRGLTHDVVETDEA